MHFGTRFLIGSMSVVLSLFSMFGFVTFKKLVLGDKGVVVDRVASVPIQAPVSAEVLPNPQVVSLYPQDGAKDVTLDIEDPLTVRFDTSVKGFFVDFRLDPPVEISYENNQEKTEFKLLPKTPLRLATPYTLKVFMKQRGMGDNAYQLLSSSQFMTPEAAATTAQQTTADKLRHAKQDTVARIVQGRYIDITLSNQVMVLFEDGVPLDAYLMSSGKRGMETPKGQFKIENKVKRAWSKSYGLYMPYWMAITPSGKFGIHELPEWPSGYKEGANHLGIPVSHGCVRLGIGPAQRVWNFATVGTPVIIH